MSEYWINQTGRRGSFQSTRPGPDPEGSFDVTKESGKLEFFRFTRGGNDYSPLPDGGVVRLRVGRNYIEARACEHGGLEVRTSGLGTGTGLVVLPQVSNSVRILTVEQAKQEGVMD